MKGGNVAAKANMNKKTFWVFFSIAMVAGFAMGLVYDAPVIVSVGIMVVFGLAIIFADRLLNRKKATV